MIDVAHVRQLKQTAKDKLIAYRRSFLTPRNDAARKNVIANAVKQS